MSLHGAQDKSLMLASSPELHHARFLQGSTLMKQALRGSECHRLDAVSEKWM
jgi:hypothetical protein